MNRSIATPATVAMLAFGAGALVWSCDDGGGDEPTIIGGTDAGSGSGSGGGSGCPAGVTQCTGQVYQICDGARFVDQQTCGVDQVCLPGIGCAACNPAFGDICIGDEARTCTDQGAVGDLITTCAPGTCRDGRCSENNDCAPGSELIYVVDNDNALLSFDPRTDQFQRLGALNCPASAPWPAWGQPRATPFSMSVDRQDRAWVLYTSGEIFWVSLDTLACERSPWQPGTGGFELFGMGFVSAAPGSNRESLYIAGGAVDSANRGRVARIDPNTLELTDIGRHAQNDFGPELTGNANAELWGYFPGDPASVARLDKGTGGDEQRWPIGALQRPPRGWAFAHWGGRYHIFVTTQGALGLDSQVLRFDPASGDATVLLDDLPWIIVGAGVSTCAPVVSNF
jgi:hypothetical protein